MEPVKRPRGRPPEGVKVEVRLPVDVVAEADRRAKAAGSTRAKVLRDLLVDALTTDD